MIALLVMTDGRRELIEQTIPTLEHLHGPITNRVIHDDSGDPHYRDWLRWEYPDWQIVFHPAGRQGFGGAYHNAWRYLSGAKERFVFSTEDDFLFTRPVDLQAMADVLDENPCLAQMALRRQAWSDAELAAGGVVEQHPEAYRELFDQGHRHWLEHRLFFTTNPSLFRQPLCVQGWPNVPRSEGAFSAHLFSDPDTRCGYWGPRDDEPWVDHIGHQRTGVGY